MESLWCEMDIVHYKRIINAIHKTLHYITLCDPLKEKKTWHTNTSSITLMLDYCVCLSMAYEVVFGKLVIIFVTPYTKPYTNQGKDKTKWSRHKRDRSLTENDRWIKENDNVLGRYWQRAKERILMPEQKETPEGRQSTDQYSPTGSCFQYITTETQLRARIKVTLQ